MYKLSKYTRLSTYDKTTVLYSSFSGAMLELNNDYSQKLDELLNKNIVDETLLNALKAGHFIEVEDIDLVDVLKFTHHSIKFDKDTLVLTIAPTMECNFKCDYCYEEGYRRHTMSPEIQEQVIEFILKYSKNIKELKVTWYGGEPLIALAIIETLTAKIKAICSDNNIIYSASMVSNGYLLNLDVAQKLKDLDIKLVQITLDGPKHIHDQRRILLNNKGTYNTIINNIKEIHSLITVVIRINVDIRNAQYLEDILIDLKENNLHRNVHIYVAEVDDLNSSEITCHCITTEHFGKLELDFYNKAVSYGFKIFNLPKANLNICGAVLTNAFVIDPCGYLYKCWNTIGNRSESIGNIATYNGQLTANLLKWLNYSPFNEECNKCDVLPLCLGGCPYQKLKFDSNKCKKYKYNLDENLDLCYKIYKKSNNNSL